MSNCGCTMINTTKSCSYYIATYPMCLWSRPARHGGSLADQISTRGSPDCQCPWQCPVEKWAYLLVWSHRWHYMCIWEPHREGMLLGLPTIIGRDDITEGRQQWYINIIFDLWTLTFDLDYNDSTIYLFPSFNYLCIVNTCSIRPFLDFDPEVTLNQPISY